MATPSERQVGYEQEPEDHRASEPVGADGGEVICQEPVGRERVRGGGEYPDKDTPPTPPAPGAAGQD